MRPNGLSWVGTSLVTYTHYATSSKEQTGDIITFAQFEEGDLFSENHEDE